MALLRKLLPGLKQAAKSVSLETVATRGLQTSGPRMLEALGTAPVIADKSILHRFMALPEHKEKTLVTYIWIDGTGEHLRTKTRVLEKEPERPEDCPKWGYDGSSCAQAQGHDSDIFLVPGALFPDPWYPGRHKLLMCETYNKDMKPLAQNHRAECKRVMDLVKDHKPTFGIEQEYTMLHPDGRPLGWPQHGAMPGPQGPYYCSVGATRAIGRDVCESHMLACIYAGIEIGGTNAEVMPGQWEYQVGICEGLSASDETWVSRYIMYRIAEEYGIVVTFDPKPMEGDWNGAGAHINFQYEAMRKGQKDPIGELYRAIDKLSKRHKQHIEVYDPHGGVDNARRLTGAHETSSVHDFRAGVADRGASIRIPRGVDEAGFGYLEDRRPSSNVDPYAATAEIVKTCLLDA